MGSMQNMPNGLPFFEVLKKKDGGFNEYVAADGFLGEYVTKLEQQSKASSESTDGALSSGQPQTPTPKSSLPRWKRRTAQQIEANKQAQKRYREKKKAKLQQASAKVDTLQQQTQDFNALEGEIRNKNAENVDLEAQLLSLEAEIQRIRVELDAKTPQAKFDSQKSRFSLLGPRTLEDKTETIGVKWKKAKEKLDLLLEKESLDPSKSSTISQNLNKKLEKRCTKAVIQCMDMLSFGGPALDDLLTTLPGGPNQLLREDHMDHYIPLVQSMNLTPQQIQGISNLLPTVSQRLARIYEERQRLNSEILNLLVAPNPSQERICEGFVEAQARTLEQTLNSLEKNLREEQILESEHHYVIMREILTNLQGAWFISKAYPRHCDTFAFMQAVQTILQK